MTCKDCLHYKCCFSSNSLISDRQEKVKDDLVFYDYVLNVNADEKCKNFTKCAEWVHLPNDEYTFTIRGDLAKGIIIANCRAAEKLEREKK